jgi:hypothetical protein
MAIENVLAAIGGALHGGVQGYAYTKELQDKERQQREMEANRLDAIQVRKDAEKRQEQRDAETRAAKAQEQQAQDAILGGLPDDDSPMGLVKKSLLAQRAGFKATPDEFAAPAKAAAARAHDDELHGLEAGMAPSYATTFHAAGHKGVKPEYFVTPEQQATADAQKRALDVVDYQKKQEIEDQIATRKERRAADRERQKAATIPVTKDDPALPRGVTAYISTLPSKYGGNYKGADQEFQQQLPGLLAAHPNLDIRKARQAFDASFSAAAIPKATGTSGARLLPPSGSAGAPAAGAPPVVAAGGTTQTATPPTGAVFGIQPRTVASAPTALSSAAPALGVNAGAGRGGPATPVTAAPVTNDDLALHARTILQQHGQAVTPQNLQLFIQKNRAQLESEIQSIRGSGQ